jgi:hypothetical protein
MLLAILRRSVAYQSTYSTKSGWGVSWCFSFVFTCPLATVNFDSHASGTWMMTVGQETNPLGHKWMIQLLDNSQPRVGVARQYLSIHYTF